MERDTGTPAIAYSHASFFVAFKALEIRDPIEATAGFSGVALGVVAMKRLHAAASLTARCLALRLRFQVWRTVSRLRDFYRGKTIELAIAGAAAGGYDVAARTIADHMSRHIPGHPAIVVRNMPGAAGLVVTNYLYNVAKRDGTVIGMPTNTRSPSLPAD